jgi:hypothetical protein
MIIVSLKRVTDVLPRLASSAATEVVLKVRLTPSQEKIQTTIVTEVATQMDPISSLLMGVRT